MQRAEQLTLVVPAEAPALFLHSPQDRHDAYKALGIKVIAYSEGSTGVTGSLPADLLGDNVCAPPLARKA